MTAITANDELTIDVARSMSTDALQAHRKRAESSLWSADQRVGKNPTPENQTTRDKWAARVDLIKSVLEEKGAAGRKSGERKAGTVKALGYAERLNFALIAFVNSSEFTAEAKRSFLEGVPAFVENAQTAEPTEQDKARDMLEKQIASLPEAARGPMLDALKALGVKTGKATVPEWGKQPEGNKTEESAEQADKPAETAK